MAIASGNYLIGTGAASSHAGYDGGFETLAAFASECAGQTLTGPLTGYIQNEQLSTAEVTFTPVTTTTNRLTLTCAPGAFHGAVPGQGARILGTDGEDFAAIRLNCEFTTLDGFTLIREDGSGDNDRHFIRSSAAGTAREVICRRMLFCGDADGVGSSWGGRWYFTNQNATTALVRFENCIGFGGGGISGDSGALTKYQALHCTMIHNSTNVGISRSGFRNMLAKNCIAAYFGPSGFSDFHNIDGTSVTNASADSSGSSGLQSLDPATHCENISSFPWDVKPATGSSYISAGTVGVLATDMLGNAYANPPSVGALEISGGSVIDPGVILAQLSGVFGPDRGFGFGY